MGVTVMKRPPESKGLYNDRYERDSCGIGCIVDIKGRAQRKVVTDGNKILIRLTHRGAKQGEDGDGAGIMVGMPHRYFKKLSCSGQLSFLCLPPVGRYGVGMMFLPNGEGSEGLRVELMEKIESVIRHFGLSVLGWRSPLPTKSSILGPIGRATEPFPAQIFVCRPEDNEDEKLSERRASRQSFFSMDDDSGLPYLEPLCDSYDPESSFSAFAPYFEAAPLTATSCANPRLSLEQVLYLIRKHLAQWTAMYVCSFSSQTIVYKGQLQSEQLFSYYDDLMDEDFTSYFAIVHARFSTNTFPTWDRAHPFRRIAHNGEINTIESNRRWLVAKQGNVTTPPCLGLNCPMSHLLPFEEPCYSASFSAPAPIDNHHRLKMSKKHLSHPIACGGVPHVRDSLAVPTDIVSARQGSIMPTDSEDSSDPLGVDGFPEGGEFDQTFNTPKTLSSLPPHLPTTASTGSSHHRSDGSPSSQHSSDSALLDNIVELLMMAGRDIVEAVMLLVPEALHKTEPQWKHDYFHFNSCVMEPWDGPALIAFTDGQKFGALLDRNGLRPGRYILSKDNTLVLASEVGVVDIAPSMIVRKGRVLPGKFLLVDFAEQRIIDDEEVKQTYARKHPYGKWLKNNAIHLDDYSIGMTEKDLRRELRLCQNVRDEDWSSAVAQLVACSDHEGSPQPHPGPLSSVTEESNKTRWSFPGGSPPPSLQEELSGDTIDQLISQLTMFGYTPERLDVLLSPMAKYSSEALGSLGHNTPLACFSELPRTPGDYFHQLFAQGTNPSIDPIRETEVMSLACPIGPQGDLFTITPQHVKRIFLNQPILKPSEYRVLTTLPGFPTATLDLTVPFSSKGFDLEWHLQRIQQEAAAAVMSGCHILILSDAQAGKGRLPIWTTLATGAVHLHLIDKKLRLRCAIVVETGEASEVHQIALLLSSGADAIFPYLAFRMLSLVKFNDGEECLALTRLIENYITAVHLGLLRVMAKIGVSTLSSYKGGFFFQALGLATNVLQVCYDAGTAAIGGVDFPFLAEDTLRFYLKAFPPPPCSSLSHLPDTHAYRFASIQEVELHSSHPDTIRLLQKAVETNNPRDYREFAAVQNALIDATEIRGQLQLVYGVHPPIDLSEVEPVSEVAKRFVTSAMSYGSISQEAYTVIAEAMEELGGRSNTGEGREFESPPLKRRFKNQIKQIGSARFGVSAEYLCDAQELQITCGQGSSLEEGLPHYKVLEGGAAERPTPPAVGWISPPPHHDMYSIEDVAQLIMDLKHVNPKARVSIKLASKLGVGVIAAGCLKAKADHLVISGSSGDSAANKFSSMKHSGLPWEIGLAETHQTLCLNGIRERVSLQVDGGLRTGRDVIIAALLGAEEFGFGTYPLVALGCKMQRRCGLNTCEAGIPTTDLEPASCLSQKERNHLVQHFLLIAEEVRVYMAKLGIRQFNQLIGRSDLLQTKTRLKEHWKRYSLDFQQTLMPGWKLSNPLDRWQSTNEPPLPRPMYCIVGQDHELDKVLDREIIRRAKRSLEHKLPSSMLLPIRNVDRSVGGLLANEIVTRHGGAGLAPDTIRVNFRGAAGQSFACWLPPGVTFYLSGDCNDFSGKGLSGGTLIVKPPSDSLFFHESNQNIICGNAALYGATSGHAFFAGIAGERFAVRNSGATAVVEGCGDFGCEYMTRGMVLILGKTGRSFAAGMTGGIAYVVDLCPSRVNTQMVELQPLTTMKDPPTSFHTPQKHTFESVLDTVDISHQVAQLIAPQHEYVFHDSLHPCTSPSAQPPWTFSKVPTPEKSLTPPKNYEPPLSCQPGSHDEQVITHLLTEHFKKTHSPVAQHLLNTMPESLSRFTKVFPKEIRRVLKQAITDYMRTGSPDAAALLDDWETITTQTLKLDPFYLQTLPFTMRQLAENYRRRERQRKRVEYLNLHENTLRVLGGFSFPSPLQQYAAELISSGRSPDLLTDHHREQLTCCFKLQRSMYIYWRKGYPTGMARKDTEILKSLLPTALTASRRHVLKAFLFEEALHYYEHLEALEDCTTTAQTLLQHSNPTIQTFIRNPPSPLASLDHSPPQQENPPQTHAHKHPCSEVENAAATSTTPPVGFLVTATTPRAPLTKPVSRQHLHRLRGFLLYGKWDPAGKTPSERFLDWKDISLLPVYGTSRVFEQLIRTQGALCTDCGTPTCRYPRIHRSGGCALDNSSPAWNMVVFEGQWKKALKRLLNTHKLLRFTRRLCAAPCESNCLLGSIAFGSQDEIHESVAIQLIKRAPIQRGRKTKYNLPRALAVRTQFTVAIIGSGPAGLAAAQQLNGLGYCVRVFEQENYAGGRLTYAIPKMCLDKRQIVQRCIHFLQSQGIHFHLGTRVGRDVFLSDMLHQYHAVLIAVGQSIPKTVHIAGYYLKGIIQATDFLRNVQEFLFTTTHRQLIVDEPPIRDSADQSPPQHGELKVDEHPYSIPFINEAIRGKRIVIIGSGYLATDSLATVIRLGCSSVIQLCCQLSDSRSQCTPFNYAHKEAVIHQRSDPRVFNVIPLSFMSSPSLPGQVGGVRAIRVTRASKSTAAAPGSHLIMTDDISPGLFEEPVVAIPETEQIYSADLVILALGFNDVHSSLWASDPAFLKHNADIKVNSQSHLLTLPKHNYTTTVGNLFACGHCRVGPSLVLTRIAEGRNAAHAIDRFLTYPSKSSMSTRNFLIRHSPPFSSNNVDPALPDSDSL